jgi:uncharacterized protein YjbJ (UPF0337 family)
LIVRARRRPARRKPGGFFLPHHTLTKEHIMDKNQVKGEMHKAKGKVKEVAGRTIGNDKMENEGKLEHAKGTIQKAYGDLKSDVKKATK